MAQDYESEKLYCPHCDLSEIPKGEAWQDQRQRSWIISHAVVLKKESGE